MAIAEQPKNVPINDVLPPHEQRDVEEIYAKLQKTEAKLIGPNGKTEILPPNVNAFLYGLLRDLKAGHSVSILQGDAQLTTVDAAKLLGMSRQFLIKLLERGEIPYHNVGKHRRIYARNVLAYKAKRDTSRRNDIVEMALKEHQEGRYDIPDDFNTR